VNHPFSSVADELKTLVHKLNACTYEAVFARTVDERQRATSQAVVLQQEVGQVFDQAYEAANLVAGFMRRPHDGRLMNEVARFVQLVDEQQAAGYGSKMQAGSQDGATPCTAMPSIPAIH
jgi:hypothetical protein